MRIVGDSTTAEMLWEWALAEWDSSRFAAFYPDLPEVHARLRSGVPYDHSQIFDQRISSTLARVHEPELRQILPARLRWRRATLEPQELGALRILNVAEFKRIVPHSALLDDMVRVLEGNAEAVRNIRLVRAYHEVKDSFDPALIRGAPILLAAQLDGPFHILEGHRRLSCLHARFRDGRLPPQDVEVVLGIWPELKTWSGYHDIAAPFQPAK